MRIHNRILRALGRKITVLIIPYTEHRPWRLQFSLGFIVFCLSLWSGLTIWAGYLAGRHVDYWITRADNRLMTHKVSYLAKEMERSREVLKMVRSTDRQMRRFLSLSEGVLDSDTGIGGPTSTDRSGLKNALVKGAAGINQPIWRKEIVALREESVKRLASFQEISWYMSNQRSLYKATPSLWPAEGQITSLFGYRFSPLRRHDGKRTEYHQGIDIASKPDTKIYATADGTVRRSGWSRGYGRMVLLDHGYGVSTLYAHTSKAVVKPGDRVTRGQLIAYMGTTGRSTGAHLHYEVWRHSKPVNPMIYLKVRASDARLVSAGSPKATGR